MNNATPYEIGLDEAFGAVKKVLKMDDETREDVFGRSDLFEIFDLFNSYQLLALLQDYENAIKVGDEVYLIDEHKTRVVTALLLEDRDHPKAIQFTGNGKWVIDELKDLNKTGRNFSQIVDVLNELKEK